MLPWTSLTTAGQHYLVHNDESLECWLSIRQYLTVFPLCKGYGLLARVLPFLQVILSVKIYSILMQVIGGLSLTHTQTVISSKSGLFIQSNRTSATGYTWVWPMCVVGSRGRLVQLNLLTHLVQLLLQRVRNKFSRDLCLNSLCSVSHLQASTRIPNPYHTVTAYDRVTSRYLYWQNDLFIVEWSNYSTLLIYEK